MISKGARTRRLYPTIPMASRLDSGAGVVYSSAQSGGELRAAAVVMSSDNGNDIIGAFMGAGFGVYSFFRGFRVLRNKRLIENTPTSKCRSVAMGLCEVAGRAVGEQTIPSLIGHMPCYCSQVLVERYERRGKSSRWVKLRQEFQGVPFFLEDSTGRVRVDPAGAELDIPAELEYSTSSGARPLLGMTLERLRAGGHSGAEIANLFAGYCASRGIGFHGTMRFTERNLATGDPVYVLGSAEEQRGVADEFERVIIRKGKHHPWFFIAEASEKELLKKMSTSTLLNIFGGAALSLACAGYLLYKFGWWQ